MEHIIKNDYYEIRLSSLVSNVDKDVIIELYQPLIGAIATITYLTLVKQKRNEAEEDIYSLETLLNTMQINASTFVSARRTLEAVGLLKTFEKVNGDVHTFVYEIFAPKTPRDFFDDILFRGLLIQYIGEKETQKLADAYEINTEIDKESYRDISASFVEVFNPQLDSGYFEQKVGNNVVGHKSKNVKTDLDMSVVLDFVEENSQIKREALNEYLDEIRQLATLFGLDEKNIAFSIIDAYDEANEPHINIKKLYNIARERAHYPFLQKKNDKKYTKSDVNSDTIIAEKIKLMEESAPVVFLEILQGGTKAAYSDIAIVSALSSDYNLPNGIINAIVEYTLAKCNNILNKFYAEKVAASIVRSNITSTIDAMNYLNKITNKKSKAKKVSIEEKIIDNRGNKAVNDELVKENTPNEHISDDELQALLDSLE